jgi:hypothetical protein
LAGPGVDYWGLNDAIAAAAGLRRPLPPQPATIDEQQ